jgi:hypothetical protein
LNMASFTLRIGSIPMAEANTLRLFGTHNSLSHSFLEVPAHRKLIVLNTIHYHAF